MTILFPSHLSHHHLADRFGFAHATRRPAALDAFAEASEGLLAYRQNTGAAIESALAIDPALPAAHALQGFALMLAGREETLAPARACLAAAHPITADEAALAAGLRHALETGPLAAAAVLDAHLRQRPQVALIAKLASMLRFLGGDITGLLASSSAVLPAWSADMQGYGYILGCHAFALEENGAYDLAEATGRAALAAEPRDPWAVHAVAHVLEMTGRAAEGIAWIEASRPGWSGCNNFAYHLSWHLALFHLEQGDIARVLGLYDQDIRPDRSEDNRDFANAASLLWRLRQDGVAVGDRWEELAAIARRRRHETTHVFTALHRLFALVATGDRPAAHELVQALGGGGGEQGAVGRAIGVPLGRAILALSANDPLKAIAAALPPLGGSNAQRDVFMRTLIRLAAARKDSDQLGTRDQLGTLVRLRRQMKRDDRFLDRTR